MFKSNSLRQSCKRVEHGVEDQSMNLVNIHTHTLYSEYKFGTKWQSPIDDRFYSIFPLRVSTDDVRYPSSPGVRYRGDRILDFLESNQDIGCN